MVRIRITEAGVFYGQAEENSNRERELPVGEILELEKEPLGWAGKYELVSDTEGLELEVADSATGDLDVDAAEAADAAMQEIDSVAKSAFEVADPASGPDTDSDETKKPDIEAMKATYADLGGKGAKWNWGVKAYTKAIEALQDGGNDNF